MSSSTDTRDSDVARPVAGGEAPYPGPRPFTAADRDRFFGRPDEVLELVSLVRSHQIVLVHAASGVGKTSLVEAGLRPKLEGRGQCVVYPTTRVRGPAGEGALASPGNVYANNVLRSLDIQVPATEAAEPTLARGLEWLFAQDAAPGDVLRLVVVDQLEELFTFYPERWQDRRGFFEQVQQAMDRFPLLRIVLAMRDDYLARLEPYAPVISDGLRTRYALERLRREPGVDAVTQPVAGTGRTFSADAAELLVDSLLAITPDSPDAPTVLGEFVESVELQVVCLDLWQRLPAGVTTITTEHVRDLARIGEVLARFYDEAITTVARTTHVREKRVRAWVERCLITPSGTRGLVFRDATTTGGLPNRAVDVLEERRLIRSEQRGGSQWYELTHDRLVRAVRDSNRRWFAARAARMQRRWVLAACLLLGVVIAGGAYLILKPDPLPRLTALDETATHVPRQVETIEAEGGRGDILLLDTDSSQLSELSVRLIGPDGTLLAEAKAEPSDTDDVPTLYVPALPADGTYKVEVAGAAGGSYAIRSIPAIYEGDLWGREPAIDRQLPVPNLGSAEPPGANPEDPGPAPPGGPDDESDAIGSRRPSTGTFKAVTRRADQAHVHALRDTAPGLAIVTVTTDEGEDLVDLQVLRTEETPEEASADYTSTSHATVVLDFPGDYVIRPLVGDRDAYVLSVDVPTAVPLLPGTPVAGDLGEDGEIDVYSVELQEGEIGLVRVTSDVVQPFVDVFSHEGLGVNVGTRPIPEGGAGTKTSFVAVRAEEGALFYLIVTAEPGLESDGNPIPTSGPYDLSVLIVQPP